MPIAVRVLQLENKTVEKEEEERRRRRWRRRRRRRRWRRRRRRIDGGKGGEGAKFEFEVRSAELVDSLLGFDNATFELLNS